MATSFNQWFLINGLWHSNRWWIMDLSWIWAWNNGWLPLKKQWTHSKPLSSRKAPQSEWKKCFENWFHRMEKCAGIGGEYRSNKAIFRITPFKSWISNRCVVLGEAMSILKSSWVIVQQNCPVPSRRYGQLYRTETAFTSASSFLLGQ